MRFHQSVTFLEMDQLVPIARATEELGFDGNYISDHLFNPRSLESRYTYSTAPDGAPFWDKDMAWPDPMTVIAAMAAVTETITFTTGVYIAPLRDLMTITKSVGTTAVLSNNRVRLGVGVGWCKEEFDQTGQEFTTRGKRLNEIIPALRALWSGGWVEYHGEYYDVPECQINPSPTKPVPILGGGHSDVAFRRAVALCDGWIAAGAYSVDEAWAHLATLKEHLEREGRSNDDFSIYMSIFEMPSVDLYQEFEAAGVTDLICAPWMMVPQDTPSDQIQERRYEEMARFAQEIIEPMKRASGPRREETP
jgi:probable F420-dependent oxidoreductase